MLYTRRFCTSTMRQQTAIVLALFIAAVTVIGAASYTQATVDRDANIQVETDDAALVGLSVGGGITDDSVQNVNGELVLNLDDGTGVNGNATYNYGEPTESARDQSNTAFNVTNNDDSTRTFDLSYAVTGTDGDTTADNVNFIVYEGDGTGGLDTANGTTVTESTGQSVTLAAGDSAYVFIEVDTDSGNLDSGSDLSGTFTVKAS